MKKITALILITMLLFSQPVLASDSIAVNLNGETITFDTEPIIVNGTTLVPLRAIFEALGATVEWDQNTKTVLSKLDSKTVSLTINSNVAYKNGEALNLLEAPTIVDNRTLVPVRFIAESFGLTVGWDASTKSVLITTETESTDWTTQTISSLGYNGNKLIIVDGGDLAGSRQANVKVDIGYGEREYYAFTNDYGQLKAVIAEEIILQDESIEETVDGRYYSDEAKVAGTESSLYDEGHVIADSLGGVSNAYNITPEESQLNRYGAQAYMEKIIRQADGCEELVAIITYPNTSTQIPSHYSFTYKLMGEIINDEFDNIGSEVEEVTPVDTSKNISSVVVSSSDIVISSVDKRAEYVIIKNTGSVSVDLCNWELLSEKGNQYFFFPIGSILEAGEEFKVVSNHDDEMPAGDFIMAHTTIWNNSSSDPAVLFNASGIEVSRK